MLHNKQTISDCLIFQHSLQTIKSIRPATLQRARNCGIEIHTFDEVEKLGAQVVSFLNISLLSQSRANRDF